MVGHSPELIGYCAGKWSYLPCRIDAAGAAGLSERELIGYESPKKALTLLTQLLEVCLIVAVGSSERRYTSHVNSRMWIVHSLKDTKGNGLTLVQWRL